MGNFSAIKLDYKSLTVAVAITITAGTVLLKDYELPGCPFDQYFHFCCPMCGSTRAWQSLLLVGEIKQAFRFNPIFLLWGFWCIIVYLDLWDKALFSRQMSIGRQMLTWVSQNEILFKVHLVLSLGSFIYLNLPRVSQWRDLVHL